MAVFVLPSDVHPVSPSGPVLGPRLERNTFGSSILVAQKRVQNGKTLTLNLEHLRKSNYCSE